MVLEVSTPLEEQAEPERSVARVFFEYHPHGLLQHIRGLPLQNHLENVSFLARHWDADAAFGAQQTPSALKQTQPWLIEAARRHDEGKVRYFSLQLNKDSRQWAYSFRGHRFAVSDDRLYVQWLIRLHHGFGVHDITEAQALLKQARDPALHTVAQCFPLDLYALEMCDQIEAEAASRAFGQASSHRVFMEFEIQEYLLTPAVIRLGVFPYPFALPEIHFTMDSFVIAVPEEKQQDEATLKQWLIHDGAILRKESKEIYLCAME